jgi:ATP-dependent RNA helicase DDX21
MQVSEATVEALKRRGIERFFPIQEQTFDLIYDKHDVVGRARTGTGKVCTDAGGREYERSV